MNKTGFKTGGRASQRRAIDIVNAGLGRRYRRERRFRFYGIGAILASLLFLSILFGSIISKGYSAFEQTFVRLDVFFDPALLSQEALATADYSGIIKASLRHMFPEVSSRKDKRMLYKLVSSGAAFQIRKMVLNSPEMIGKTVPVWVPADDDIDMLLKGHFDLNVPESERRIKDIQLAWVDRLKSENRIEKRFNRTFFTAGDSREPELAGILGAVMGSVYTLLVTLALSFPIGIASAVYLEEFAPKNRWTDFIEVNINNLAAVPSIVFGLLGLAVFLNFFGLPRSAPAGGGPGADLDDPADDHHRRTGLAAIRTALYPRSGVGGWRLQDANGHAPRAAPGHAGDYDGHHHRHGPGSGRIRPTAHDRHGGLYRRCAPRPDRCGHRAAGSDLSVGGQPGTGLCGTDLSRHHRAAGLPDHHECHGRGPSEEIRTPLVGISKNFLGCRSSFLQVLTKP